METEKNLARKIFQDFLGMIVFDTALIILAIIFYNGNFLLWQYPLSTSGVSFTYVESNRNLISMILFGSAMFLSGIVLAKVAITYQKAEKIKNRLFKIVFLVLGSLGFFVTAFSPDDTRHIYHVFGMAFAVASLWLLAFVYLAELHNSISLSTFLLMEFLLNLPLFAYAQAYFIKFDPASYNFQKIALFCVAAVLLKATHLQAKFTRSVNSDRLI